MVEQCQIELNVQLVEFHNEYGDYLDDLPIKRTRPISETYERCNVVVLELVSYEGASNENG